MIRSFLRWFTTGQGHQQYEWQYVPWHLGHGMGNAALIFYVAVGAWMIRQIAGP